jgi:hypothetical protein
MLSGRRGRTGLQCNPRPSAFCKQYLSEFLRWELFSGLTNPFGKFGTSRAECGSEEVGTTLVVLLRLHALCARKHNSVTMGQRSLYKNAEVRTRKC